MNRILVNLKDIPTTRLQLGFEGENDHTQVIFDCTLLYSRYPSAVASMTVRSPSGGLYPKTLVQSGNKLVWNITASDCAKFGSGQFQLTFTSGTEVIKTYIGSFSVNASLVGGGDPPDPVEDWLQEAQEALDAFEQDTSDAEAWAVGTRDGDPVGSTDPAYHNNSKYYAEQAGSIEQTIETTGAAQVEAIEAKGEEVLESIPSDYTALSEDVDELYAIKAPAIECSASGSIVSFADGADGMPLRSLSVAIEPVQDLHGQDAPYPPGGGKNKFNAIRTNFQQNGVTITKVSDGVYRFNGTATATFDFYFTSGTLSEWQSLPAGNYIVNGLPSESSTFVLYFCISIAGNTEYIGVATNGTSVSLDSEGAVGFFVRVYSGAVLSNTEFKPMIRLSSISDSTFAPYSNICPITGWTGAKVTRTGKNLATTSVYKQDYVLTDAGAESPSTNFCITDIVPIVSGSKYVCSYIRASGGSDVVRIGLYDADMNFLSRPVFSNSGDVITAPAEAKYARLSYRNVTPDLTNIQLEQGQTATAYQAFSGSTAEYEFPQSAGTVYGGTLTIHQDGSGELVVDRAYIDFKGKTFTGGWSLSDDWVVLGCSLSGLRIKALDTSRIKRSMRRWSAAEAAWRVWSQNDNQLGLSFNRSVLIQYGYDGSTAESAKAAAVAFENSMPDGSDSVVYVLATPVTYQLTALEVIETLKGNNVLWADTGDVAVSYPADTRLFIEKKISELQALILENISNS